MNSFNHIPVLSAPIVRLVGEVNQDGLHCDLTVGAGGHARLLLEAYPNLRIIGFDRDATAIKLAAENLRQFQGRFTLVHSNFGQASFHLKTLGEGKVATLLVDLGVSSMQLDHAERGFSFLRSGPLDMRMDQAQGPTARELIASSSETELADMLWRYGDEKFSRRIARAMKAEVEAGGLQTTGELAALVERVIGKRELNKHPATRTFQALRIATNQEVQELESLLENFVDLLAPGGRFLAIAFHSLEERLVRQKLKSLVKVSGFPDDIAERMGLPTRAPIELLTRKAISPDVDELGENPRSRSARLYVAQKLASA